MAIIEDHKYTHFQGELKEERRWLPIFLFGIECTLKKKMTISLLFVVWMSAIIQCVLFLLVTQGQLDVELVNVHGQRYFSKTLIRILDVQMPWLILLLALVGSGLISNDLSKGAHQIYFARPITTGDYLFGKFLVTFFYVFIGLWLPLIIFWFYTFCFSGWGDSPNWRVVALDINFWRLMENLLLLIFVSISLGFLLLMFSSLSPNSIFVAVVFVSVFVFGKVLEELIAHVDALYPLHYFSYITNLRILGRSMLEMHHELKATSDLILSGAIVVTLLLISRIVLYFRLRKIIFSC